MLEYVHTHAHTWDHLWRCAGRCNTEGQTLRGNALILFFDGGYSWPPQSPIKLHKVFHISSIPFGAQPLFFCDLAAPFQDVQN